MLQPDAADSAGLQIDGCCQIGKVVLCGKFNHKKIPPCGAWKRGKPSMHDDLYKLA